MKQGRCIGVSAMAILLFAAALGAQETTASLRGTVFDATGARVPSAAVTVVQNETGFTRSSASDANGDYLLVLLPVGHYRLEVAAKGFRNYVQEGISLRSTRWRRCLCTLRLDWLSRPCRSKRMRG